MILGLTIVSIGIFNGLMLSFVFLSKRIPTLYLGFFILGHCLVLASSINDFLPSPEKLSFLSIVGDVFGLTIAPFLYFYCKSYLRKSFSVPIHFLPAVTFIIASPLLPESQELDILLPSARIFQGVFYLIVLFDLIKQDKWLSVMAFLFSIELISTVIHLTLPFDSYFAQLLLPFTIIVVISFITFSSMTGSRFMKDHTLQKKKPKSQSNHQKTFEAIRVGVENSELYLNPNIKLADLALQLNLSEKQISQAINDCTGENVNLFINRYRIKTAERLLIEQSRNITIDAIAELSGFSNKVSFYKAFRKVHTISPKEYIERKTIEH